ncbi:hypothetical protein HYT01_02020 [Candidatus Giovannonibacteria bacterium]|nr:hypothetical protein [Candidatus Giovannonibacteria bacterium]
MPDRDLVLNIYKILGLAGAAFFVGIMLTPLLTHYLYKYKLWKKNSVAKTITGELALISQKLHNDEAKKTPRMGGILVWGTTLLVALFFWLLQMLFPDPIFSKLNFLSRNQTWVPLGILLAGALVGLVDDVLVVTNKGTYNGGGLTATRRILLVAVIAIMGAYWFYFKLGVNTVFIPGFGEVTVGLLFIPIFIIVMLAVFSGGVIDGLDGLSGGVLASIFASYSGIAFFQNQVDIAAFCAVITGAILAFLWFNIPPARFYMSETGIMGLMTTLTVVAFLTDAVAVLPIIAFPLVIESASVIIQLLSKKFLKRKVFLVAPIHHHFEALGWPSSKVVMRFWIIGFVFSILGLIIHLISRI